MIATTYTLPFAFDVPVDNPWDGKNPVGLAVSGAVPLKSQHAHAVRVGLAPFWHLAEGGGLVGTARAPWLSTCSEPVIEVLHGVAHLEFNPCVLDERATHCLLCLLLALHQDISIERAILSVSGKVARRVPFDSKLQDPYPGLWSRLPFGHEIEESESETRVLRAQFAGSLDNEQISAVHRELMRWGTAAEAGAYGVAPIDPRSCGCMPVNPPEHYQGELTWPVEKCRFHYAALPALVAVCATIHHRIATIAELAVE